LVREISGARLTGPNPFFQVVFQFLANPPTQPQFTGIACRALPMETGTSKFDLTLTLADSAEGLAGDLEYDTDLFDKVTIQRMLGHFRTLLESIVADPLKPIGALRMLPESEEQQLLVEWNNTRTDYPRKASITELFEEQALAAGDSVALIYEGTQLTYAELNTRANQLANYLKKSGVEIETPVGVCLNRSLELIIALVAVLKAGGVYVPLDPAYPEERLGLILEDTAAPVILTNSEFEQKLFSGYGGQLITVDREGDQISGEESRNSSRLVSSENLAYIMYTSGSSGQPKGVAVTQRGVVRLVVSSFMATKTNPFRSSPWIRMRHGELFS
jgi:non-ribosomal peptide synthetase component F